MSEPGSSVASPHGRLQPIEFTWPNFPRYLRRTIRDDHRLREGHPLPADRKRQLTLRTLARMVRPNLDRPVFVIGATRSGTTFLGSSLAYAAPISYHFEPLLIKAAARYVHLGLWPEWRSRFVYRSVAACLLRCSREPDLVFAEKTPVDCFVVPFLERTFSGARFVHIVRDGRDAALSHSKRPWLLAGSAGTGQYEPGGYPFGPWAQFWVEPERAAEFESTTDYHRCIWAWRRFVEAATAGLAEIDPGRKFELRYEDIGADPAGAAERLLDFLEIRDGSRAAVTTAMESFRPESVGAWERELSPQEVDVAVREAGDMLGRLGYL